MSETRKEYCIIGIDGFTLELATFLQDSGARVILLDSSVDVVEQLSSTFPYVYKIDSTNLAALESMNIAQFDIVIVGTHEMEKSILTVSNLIKLKVQKIIARVKNDVHKNVLSLLGEENVEIIWTDEIVAQMLGFRLLNGIDLNLSTQDHGISIIKVKVTNEKIFGWPLSKFELKSRFLTNVIMINRDDDIIFPVRSTTELIKDDIVTIACKNASIPDVVQVLSGEK